ncbi:MAG: hypothetical protein J3Q66DRAFT_275679 [Benniella sp.]|nr:MAG: hypothetical protein J3Q66DRAFT_275679 [Benniella sp.]
MDTFPEPVPGSIAEEQTPSTLSDNLNLPLGSKSSKAGSTDLVVTNTLTKQPDSHTQTCSSNLSDGLSTDSVSVSVTSSSAPAATAATIPASSVKTSFSPYFRILPKFREQVDRISTFTKTSITLISSQFHTPSTKPVVAAHAREEMVELLVTGSWENALAARLLLLVTIDTLQQGIAHERLEVELRFQNMIGGRKRGFIQELMAKTRTNIYLSSPFAQTTDKNGAPVETRYSEIHITGEPAKVQFAKDALLKAYTRVQATSPNSTRQVNVASRKLDWMLLNHRDKLRSIMIDNACYIAFPPLGASHPVICVYGDSKVNVERTIRTVMQLSSQFHSGSINMLSPGRENLLAISPNQPNALSPVAKVSMLASQASQVSGAEVEFRNNGFFIFGNEIQTRSAVQHLVEVDFIKATHFEIKFSVELANEHREFISGKKNGKINRIMKATGAKIKFDPCNEYNFYVDLSSTIPLKAMEALALLQEELPAEISFYVPETYHKRIIGVGGKNIQRIMKKYGVYVKFSNSEEFASLGGYFDNLDNVVARTPSKNAVNLENLKHAVMELVHPKDKDFVNHSVIIPRHYHLSLMADHAKALSEVQETTNAVVRFPERETGSDVVWISGPESFIQQATSMLLSLVDEQYVYSVPFSEAVARVLVKPEFKTEVVEKMKVAWNMTLILPAFIRSLSLTDSDDDDDGEEEDYLFVFKYSRNNESYLQNAKELLVQYLINNQIEVYDDEIRVRRPRSDSFEEAFPHFNSKILSSVTGGGMKSDE